MPPLLLAGYLMPTAFPRGYYDPDYWPHFLPAEEEAAFGRWKPLWIPLWDRDDDDEVLVILG